MSPRKRTPKKGSGDAADSTPAQPESVAPEVVIPELVEADEPVDVEPSEADLAAEHDSALPVADDDGEHAPEPPPPLDDQASRSLARMDPLSLYIRQIRRFPLISREEEHELAVKYLNTGDMGAAQKLVQANLRLVVKIAYEYQRAHKNLLDLVQEGNVGLIQAVKKYDPYRGVKLSSYAAWWIRAYIIKSILNNWRLVKIGTTQAQRKLFFNLRKEKDKLEKLGFTPTPKMLADNLAVSEQDVIDMDRRLAQGEMSLDAPVGREDDGGRTHLDLLESSGEARPDVAAEGTEFRQLLRGKLEEFEKTLRGREQTIFHERLMSETPSTLQEIGEKYGISRERARQVEKRLLMRLKDYLRRELGDAVEIAMGVED